MYEDLALRMFHVEQTFPIHYLARLSLLLPINLSVMFAVNLPFTIPHTPFTCRVFCRGGQPLSGSASTTGRGSQLSSPLPKEDLVTLALSAENGPVE